MTERLGNVIYWLGCISAIGWFVLTITVSPPNVQPPGFVIGIIGAAVLYGAGRAVRYVLAGR